MHPTPLQILAHTPAWVFAVFALLLWLGGRQLVPHSVPVGRLVALPAAMGALSLYGAVSASGGQPLALAGWAVGCGVALAIVARADAPMAATYDARTRRLSLPGSPVPLVLMLAIFGMKFAVGVALALQPARAHDTAGIVTLAVAYGAFTGIFAGRALRLLRQVRLHAAQADGLG